MHSFFLFYFSNSAKPQFKMQNAKSVLWSFGFKKARGLYYIDGVLGRRGPYIGGSKFKQYAGKMQKTSAEAKAEAPGYWILPPGIEQKIMSINHLRRPASWRSVHRKNVNVLNVGSMTLIVNVAFRGCCRLPEQPHMEDGGLCFIYGMCIYL